MKIPLEKNGKTVAVVMFDSGKVSAVAKIQAVDKGITDKIKNIVDTAGQLTRATTKSPSGFVRYWHGFWGWLSALEVTMPAIGVNVDWDNVDYP